MLQGMARGKVGDVVFSRLNGEQISRVRNRHPKNPRSNKQLYQRAIMATVMQAYSLGQEIFNHAFEGKSVGAMCQREFMRLNAKALRARLSADIAGGNLQTTIGRVTAPGVATIVPNEYIISRGSYQNQVFVENNGSYNLPAASGQETVATYATRVGLNVGDIYTFVFITTNGNEVLFSALGDFSQPVDKVLGGNFGYIRCTVKDVSAVSKEASTAKYGDVFDIELSAGVESQLDGLDLTGSLSINDFCGFDDTLGYSLGLIRSRLDVDLRSNSVMKVFNANTFGIYYNSLIEAWKKSTESIGDSDLILEGGDDI